MAEHLDHASDAELARLMGSDAATIGHAFGRLWDADPRVRERAALAVGIGVEAHPEQAPEFLRRVLWALNDESGTNGVHAIPVLGEVGARRPDLVRDFIAPAASLLWDDGLRLELLRALARIVQAAPELASEVRDPVRQLVGGGDEERRLIETIVRGGET